MQNPGRTLRSIKAQWIIVLSLLFVQLVQGLYVVHRESLTWDEDDHMFAGYMMWKNGDYGLNPEHPPLVKLLATLPVLQAPLWVPPQQGREFKAEAYFDGRDWLARNDGASQHLVFRMRMAAELLALALALIVFFVTKKWFGDIAAVAALTLVVFDPNILAHSALVTTDIGVSLFFVASIYVFHRYVRKPSWKTLLLAGIVTGLLLATKHSGILIAPMFVALAAFEVYVAPRSERTRTSVRLAASLLAIALIGVVVLWSFYGFRYAARPAGLQLSTSLQDYAAPLPHLQRSLVLFAAHLHLLPESYLMGLVDVKRMAAYYPTFVLGNVYSHGVWWYFPVVILIKSTLGLLALLVFALLAIAQRELTQYRELFYTTVPALIYLAVAMASGMNIGVRHLLPMYALLMILAGAGVSGMLMKGRGWAVACLVFLAAHFLSSLLVFPNPMTYANEAWGGPSQTYRLLSDANVDWAQQLYQVKNWQDAHSTEPCWFAYFARPFIAPSVYGIHCHALPTLDTEAGGIEPVPSHLEGTLLISAGDLSGCEWPSGDVNPYRFLQSQNPPKESLDHAIFIFHGPFDIPAVAALSRAQLSGQLLQNHQNEAAYNMALDATHQDPDNLFALISLGDAAWTLGRKAEATQAYETALASVSQMDINAQSVYFPRLRNKLTKIEEEK